MFSASTPKDSCNAKVAGKTVTLTKPYRFVKITVNGIEIPATNVEDNVVFPALDVTVTVSRDEKETSSIKLSEINHTTSKFFDSITDEYSLEIYFSKSKVTTKLPDEMSLNLLNFFKSYKPLSNKNYCCINFAYEMAYGRGKIVDDNNPDNFDELLSSEFSEEKLVPGSIVRFNKGEKEPRHYAVSIGQKSYLSLFGTDPGPLMVTSLDACKKGFGADTCVQAIKKKL